MEPLWKLLNSDSDALKIDQILISNSAMGSNGTVLPETTKQLYIAAIRAGFPLTVPAASLWGRDTTVTHTVAEMKAALLGDYYVSTGSACGWGQLQMDKLPWS